MVNCLNEGDLVVTIGQEGLREGLPIRIPGQQVTSAEKESITARPGARKKASTRTLAANQAEVKSPGDGKTANGAPPAKVDPKEVQRIEKAFMKNPFIKRMFEQAAQEDPSLAQDPAKKMAFFRRTIQRFEDRMMQNPMIQQEFAKRVQKDPELEKDLVKKLAFFRDMMRKMRSMR
ncbi:MAG: hypothetical protein D6814_16825 [Calditrichaeota bacterium]|nr:MAG: hypothetical protein D6814_16825 [Calditrichota bacterium]